MEEMMKCVDLPDPWELDKINPEIVFYHRRNDVTELIKKINYETVPSTALCEVNCSRIIFITHGFNSKIDADWIVRLKNSLVEVDDQIVAVLGWGEGAKFQNTYAQAVANCLRIGEWLSQFVNIFYNEIKDAENKYIWGIGHSLGAYLMGMAGDKSQTSEVKMFDRITGLDPAGIGFQLKRPGYRLLSKTDAAMVDVIHTDGGVTMPYAGTLLPLGTLDFYPNFGYGTAKSFPVDHRLSYECFIWSINNPGSFKTNEVLDGTPAVEVIGDSATVSPVNATENVELEAEMGYYADQCDGRQGNYYLKINKGVPFAPYEGGEKS